MHKQQWNSSLHVALLVQEVHVDRSEAIDVDSDFVIRQFIQLSFLGSPVELVSPMVDEAFDVGSGLVSLGEDDQGIWLSDDGGP